MRLTIDACPSFALNYCVPDTHATLLYDQKLSSRVRKGGKQDKVVFPGQSVQCFHKNHDKTTCKQHQTFQSTVEKSLEKDNKAVILE